MPDNVLARVVVILLALCLGVAKLRGCEVFVEQPWEENTYIPEGSVVEVSCSGGIGQSPQWSIHLPGASSPSQFSFQASITLLNSRGFYQKDSELDNSGVLLHINNTEDINGTEIQCDDISTATTISKTVLIVYEPTAMEVQVHDSQLQMVIISWTPLQYHWDGNYLLTVTSSNNDTQFYQLQEVSTFTFTAPKDAPPCEVYNFSVTATYVGATYTGAGCSVPSPVLSTMLPSLPDITPVESSIQYVLIKQYIKLTINVTFEPAEYCGEYPVNNYTLEVKGQSSDVLSNSISPQMQNSIDIHNLTENAIYSFRVLVSNSVGVVSTNSRQFITTDVQNVTATLIESMSAVLFQCDFIIGSNALGCMVVLVGEFENITANLDQNGCDILNVSHPLSSYNVIFAFDIESDGSVGTLAVPGVISDTTSCVPTTSTSSDTNTTKSILVVIGIGCGVSTATICLIILLILIICICCKFKRSKKRLMVVQPSNIYNNEPDTNCSELAHCTDEELEIQAAEILYDQPVKARERCSGDGAEYEKTKHIKDLEDNTANEREMNTHAELTEENHHYHTLEPQRVPHGLKVDPDAPALPLPYRPPSPEPLPAYQEIGSLQVTKYDQERDTTNGEIVNDQYQSSQNQPPSDEAQVSSETLL